MLEEVRITGLGVIDDAVLELSPGFNVVTGETGAGKTMVVSGLGLLFGGRADPARVRPGAERANVEGRLSVDADGTVARQVDEAGGDLDDDGGTLILSRSVSAEGRSRAHAGGRSVPVSLLTYLADDLVAVHGQADQQQLLKPGRQREALDRFAGADLAALLAAYQQAYQRHREVRSELDELTTRARERQREAEDLRLGLAEVEQVEPVEGEDIELLAEEQRLAHADALHTAATSAHEVLSVTRRAAATKQPTRSPCSASRARRWRLRPITTPRWPRSARGCRRRRTWCPTSRPTWRPTRSRSRRIRSGSLPCRSAAPSLGA